MDDGRITASFDRFDLRIDVAKLNADALKLHRQGVPEKAIVGQLGFRKYTEVVYTEEGRGEQPDRSS